MSIKGEDLMLLGRSAHSYPLLPVGIIYSWNRIRLYSPTHQLDVGGSLLIARAPDCCRSTVVGRRRAASLRLVTLLLVYQYFYINFSTTLSDRAPVVMSRDTCTLYPLLLSLSCAFTTPWSTPHPLYLRCCTTRGIALPMLIASRLALLLQPYLSILKSDVHTFSLKARSPRSRVIPTLHVPQPVGPSTQVLLRPWEEEISSDAQKIGSRAAFFDDRRPHPKVRLRQMRRTGCPRRRQTLTFICGCEP
eukprot:1179931-Prorocentrum_minimum.AAC.2